MKTTEIEFIKNLIDTTDLLKKLEFSLEKILGYPVPLKAEAKDRYIDICEYSPLGDEDSNTTFAIRKSALHRLMYKSASIYLETFHTEGTDHIAFCVHIRYKHPGGGENGLSLFDMIYYQEKGIIIVKQ